MEIAARELQETGIIKIHSCSPLLVGYSSSEKLGHNILQYLYYVEVKAFVRELVSGLGIGLLNPNVRQRGPHNDTHETEPAQTAPELPDRGGLTGVNGPHHGVKGLHKVLQCRCTERVTPRKG